VQSASRGKDAQGESIVEVEHNGRVHRGRGVSTDTVEAGARAFLNAINRIEAGQTAVGKREAV
jgi:2-isopropylmalate synthase